MRQLILISSAILFYLLAFTSNSSAACSVQNAKNMVLSGDIHLIQNSFFQGTVNFKVNDKTYIAVACKYLNPTDDREIFVTIYSCANNELEEVAKFLFFAKTLDYLKFNEKEQRLYVVFVDSTERFGWVDGFNSSLKFTMFEDPEL